MNTQSIHIRTRASNIIYFVKYLHQARELGTLIAYATKFNRSSSFAFWSSIYSKFDKRKKRKTMHYIHT